MTHYILTGTDTGIGKTVASAMLVQALEYNYWKPVQCGIEDGGVDTRRVQKMTDLPDSRFLPEAYVLTEPLSPHRAAELDHRPIDLESLTIPPSERPLIIEGAGGLMVPLTRQHLLISQFKNWNLPVILCCRTALGTLNHTLLSIEALWARDFKIQGLIFIGEDNQDNIKTIAEFSGERVLGHIPVLDDINSQTLQRVFDQNFTLSDFSPKG